MQIETSPIQTISQFSMSAPALRVAVDQIADSAMAGVDRITEALATVPAEMQPLLAELRALFGSIGYAADSTSDDVGVDLGQVWGVGV